MLKRLISRIKYNNQRKEVISAVHDDDLKVFLQSLGVLHEVENGKVKCKFCHDPISLENLEAIIPDSGSVSYICDKKVCIREFMNYMEGKNG